MKPMFLALLLVLTQTRQGAAQSSLPIRAFHLDMRIQVMTMPALRAFAQKLHAGGINTLIMEYEATYPYDNHLLIPNRYAYTKAEIVSFINYCGGLGIDVIPLQQSFGHVEYILRHQRYKPLREDDKALSQVCPLQITEDSLLFTDLYTQLAQTHPSQYIHIGCDETYLLGHCARCRKKAEEGGISKLYFDYVGMLCNIVLRLGKRPVLWADMALKYPDAIRSLPAGTVLVDWNYGWDMNRFGDHQKLLASGLTIWGAPAIRSSPDNFYLTKWAKHFNNIRDFVPAARQMGYKGMVLTSWSTSGAYSYVYESENQLSDLQAIRHVYPITGFNILISAYVASLRSPEPIDVSQFIIDYCHRQYGFTRDQSLAFWQALQTAPYEVTNGVVQSPTPLALTALIDSTVAAARTLRTLQPQKNQKEFAHYCLMADIRLQYLRFEEIEAEANSPTLTRRDIPALLIRLRALLAEVPSLSQRFIDLNKNDFYLSELKQENDLRSVRIRELYARLSKTPGSKPR
ncbi:beta-N-acetylhexosaminidase [Puia dinghuensis]|uniref:Glycoside hydrolase family 20 catalytic domain-containing protein n=1 Tax=Puia dinghuensis TaxID=1792502 RepID=A0A8J2XTL9_9BACT|nr:beta-N-acetylhexosaminidase [Puia dinghuensis]GGB05083.1 hypothetical protein GCM10011511_30500 [Puia dinghuensis]